MFCLLRTLLWDPQSKNQSTMASKVFVICASCPATFLTSSSLTCLLIHRVLAILTSLNASHTPTP